MYIQENLTTTPYELPGISWELPGELQEKFDSFGAFAKLVLNEDRTTILDIVEDTAKREQAEKDFVDEEARRMAEMQNSENEKIRREQLDIQTEKNAANLDYLSMMTGIELPEIEDM